jgi:hypothetical protein
MHFVKVWENVSRINAKIRRMAYGDMSDFEHLPRICTYIFRKSWSVMVFK